MSKYDGRTKNIYLDIELIKLKKNKSGCIYGRINLKYKYLQYGYYFKEKKEGELIYYAVPNYEKHSLIELLTLFLIELNYRTKWSTINKYTEYLILLIPKFIKNDENNKLFDDCSNFNGYEWNTNFSVII